MEFRQSVPPKKTKIIFYLKNFTKIAYRIALHENSVFKEELTGIQAEKSYSVKDIIIKKIVIIKNKVILKNS